jgi:hypothetical protein
MIPTRSRWRISRDLAFPLGAKQISEALEGVPQYASLSIWFSCHYNLTTAARIREILNSGAPLGVLEARYRHVRPGRSASRELIEMGWYEETWRLSVHPVPRERKFVTRTLLLTTGLPKIRAWLETPRPETWRDGNHYCCLLVSFAEEGTLCAEEQ